MLKKYTNNIGADLSASLVVFLIALPLCLGLALAIGNGVPLFAGIVAGVIGGIIVGVISKSQLSVSGPANSVVVVAALALATLKGGYPAFLVAVVLAGIIQIIFSIIRAGIIGDFIPNSVIKGMLAAIGILLIIKQIPNAIGINHNALNSDIMISEFNVNHDDLNIFSQLYNTIIYVLHSSTGDFSIALLCLISIIIWNKSLDSKNKIKKWLPASLIAVILAILLKEIYEKWLPNIALETDSLVKLPIAKSTKEFISFLQFPDFTAIANPQIWGLSLTLAIMASLETLLSIEAIDKIDPEKRTSPTNRELLAQGIGNILSGMIGGLPISSVILRGSVNLSAGAKTKMSTIFHGILMLLFVIFIPNILNLIPLSALAIILIVAGYRLTSVSIYKTMYKSGWDQFIPFIVTIVAIIATNLIIGIIIGILVGLFFTIKNNFHASILMVQKEHNFLLMFRKDVSFINKFILKRKLEQIPNDSYLIIEVHQADFIDKDIVEELNNFIQMAESKNIHISIHRGETKSKHQEITSATIEEIGTATTR